VHVADDAESIDVALLLKGDGPGRFGPITVEEAA
jgi:hypothetical protein